MDTPTAIKIFRAGTFTSMEGRPVSFTAADLADIAAAYDASADPAPLVVGHPGLDAPAYGWVAKLAVQGDELVALPDRVEPSFAAAVNAGRYPKVSARFWPPAHPANPRPGKWALQHVGFLGAAAPGVSGLGTVSFAASAEPLVTIITPTEIPNMPDPNEQAASFAAQEAALNEREAALAKREAQIEKDRKDALHSGNVSFAAAMVEKAALAPAGKDLLVGVLDQLDAGTMVSFGAAGELTPADALKKLLGGAKPLVDLGEIAPADEAAEQAAASFAAPAGYTVDPKTLQIHAKAVALQRANPNLSYDAAVREAGG